MLRILLSAGMLLMCSSLLAAEKYEKESVDGKYRDLIKIVDVPKDRKQYGKFYEEGYNKAMDYAGVSVPEGYWVYSEPKWYVWKSKDLKAVGYEVIKKTLKLKEIKLELQFEYAKQNKKWAEEMLDLMAITIADMEDRSGIPFPGVNPFIIEEDPNLKSGGLGGRTGIAVASPKAGNTWLMLHEVIHIWNSGSGPTWIEEGMADYMSYKVMLKHKIPFPKGDTLPDWVKEWRETRGGKKDLPLNDPKNNYNYGLAGAKTQEFFLILDEHFGDEFINKCFYKHCKDRKMTNDEFAEILKDAGAKDPARFMDGWIVKGEYQIKQSKSPGEEGAKPGE